MGVEATLQRIRWVGFVGLLWWSTLLLLDVRVIKAGETSADILNLLEIKRSITTRAAENILTDWNEADPNPCRWSGVRCDPVSMRVVSLEIHRTEGLVSNWPKCPPFKQTVKYVDDGHRKCSNYGEPSRSPGGTLSPALWKLSELRHLTIASFGLSGSLSEQIGALQSLVSLDLHSNLLNGSLPRELGMLPKLTHLRLQDNAFEGQIPAELSLSRMLAHIDLSQNTLSGRIPTSLGSLQNLQFLYLYDNRLTGPIPVDLVAAECNLRTLDLSANFLTGRIPREIDSCQKLVRLHMNFNSLNGTLPYDLSRLVNLESLQLAGNSFSGSLPDQFAQCKKLSLLVLTSDRAWSSCFSRHTERNKFSGPLPPGLSELPHLMVLWAPGAGLGGRLPENWSPVLSKLNLADNFFIGNPPSGLCRSKEVNFLNLSSNQLDYNDFPYWLHFEPWGNRGKNRSSKTANFASRPNLSSWCNSSSLSKHETFSSWSNDGSSLDNSAAGRRRYMFTRRILASNRSDDAEPVHGRTQPKKLNSVLVAAITSGCAIVIVIFILGFMFQCSKYRTPRESHRPLIGLRGGARAGVGTGPKVVVAFASVPNLTYENVVKATGNFCIDNLIGSGGFGTTYKAEVKQGLMVAVKRLNIGKFQGVQQFDTEIRTLGSIRHPNLVTLLGYHASQEEMFLIYNYFSQGNLETLIHDSKVEMEWKTRHSIALRIAEALKYLHDDCVPRVLHRDIKPSNILLDDELNAHLADFGLARLLEVSETHASTDVAGTFGYVAPEYALTCRVTEKADVYSFGVVLLELLSGKRALDATFCKYGNGFNIVTWAYMLIGQEKPRDVFTHKLREEGPFESLLETLKLAVLCTADHPSKRPPMRQVVDALRNTQSLELTT